MYLQTIMLLLRAEGLHLPRRCVVAGFRDVSGGLFTSRRPVLFCGIQLGTKIHGDYVRTGRARLTRRLRFR